MRPQDNLEVIGLAVAIATLGVGFCALAFQCVALWIQSKQLKLERENGPKIVTLEVRHYIDVALSKTGVETLLGAQAALDAIGRCIGPFLDLSDGFASRIGRLRTAMKGTIKAPTPAPARAEPLPSPGAGAAASSSTASSGSASSASASASASGSEILVVTRMEGKASETTRQATTEEHVREVRLALEALAEYWTIENVEPKLKSLQTALLRSKPTVIDDCPRDLSPKWKKC
jgi:hypothetical protein